MAIQLQVRRGTSAQMASFVGANGEVAVDLSAMRTVLHDGVTLGGWPQERAGLTRVVDANYTVLPTDVVVMYTSKTAARTVTLPPVSNYPRGQKLTIVDTSNSTTFNLTVISASSTEGVTTSSTSFVINFSTASSWGHLSLLAGALIPGAGVIGVWQRV